MRTRVCRWIQSPDAKEGALGTSNYSTERTPITALLFEAKRKIALPTVRLESNVLPAERLPESTQKAERSFPQ